MHEMVVKMKLPAHRKNVDYFCFQWRENLRRRGQGKGRGVIKEFFSLNAGKNGQIKESIKWR